MADPDLGAFGQSIELAAVAVYQTLAPALTSASAPVGALFTVHHQDQANAFAAVAGELAVVMPNAALVAMLGPDLIAAQDEHAALEFAFRLETQLVATHTWLLSQLASPDAARTVAGIVSVQSGQAGVLGLALGRSISDLYPTGSLVTAAVGDGSDDTVGFDPRLFPVR